MNKLQLLIAKHEGLRTSPYLDSVGKLTIGYGHNLDDVPISENTANTMLREDIAVAMEGCRQFAWFDELDDVRTAVVVDMVFNMGIAGFKKFKRTIVWIKEGDYKKASKEMLDSRWADQVGKRAKEWSKMMRTGEWE